MYQLASISNTSTQRCHRGQKTRQCSLAVDVGFLFLLMKHCITPKVKLVLLLLYNSFLQTPLVVLMDIYFEVMRTLVVVTILYMLYTVACVQHPVGIVLGKTLYVVLLCHSCFPVLVVNLAISNNFNNKDLVRSGLIEIFFVFRLLHIHPRGMIFPIQLKLAAFCLSAEQNRTSRID